MLYNLLKPLLFKLPAELSHHLTLQSLALAYKLNLVPTIDKTIAPQKHWNITFPNRIGLAAGLDKNADYIEALSQLGFGFIEIGTVTPRPQTGNPKPRLFRLPQAHGIINRMGFNNKGLAHVVGQLQKLQHKPIIIGANIGKNRDTPLEHAIDDYLACLTALYPLASYLVVNISSPNTPGLRDLQNEAFLKNLLAAVMEQVSKERDKTGKFTPLLIKIAPDLTGEQIQRIAQQVTDYKVDGVIATNTTIARPEAITDRYRAEVGGLSGKPVFEMSNKVIRQLRHELGSSFPIIGVGGIFSPLDAAEKLAAGADLVQIYTGLIYEGPALVKKLLRHG